MDEVSLFGKIAMYLTHPLVLVGFVVMLVFGIHKQLISSGIVQPLSKKDSAKAVQLILQYGFWLGLIIALLGVFLKTVV